MNASLQFLRQGCQENSDFNLNSKCFLFCRCGDKSIWQRSVTLQKLFPLLNFQDKEKITLKLSIVTTLRFSSVTMDVRRLFFQGKAKFSRGRKYAICLKKFRKKSKKRTILSARRGGGQEPPLALICGHHLSTFLKTKIYFDEN